MKPARMITLMLMASLMAACATLDPDYEDPVVTLKSFRALPSEGSIPSFEVGLNIMNPNRTDLNIDGIVYTISLNGHDVIKGVGKDYPLIESYSQESVTVTASASVLQGIKLIREMMQGGTGEEIEYAFEAKLDLGGFYPSVKISESGTLGELNRNTEQ